MSPSRPGLTLPAGGVERRLSRPRLVWRRLRPLLGDRTAPVLALAAASVGAGLAEAGVLTLVAQVATAMVVGEEALNTSTGPVDLRLGIGSALAVGVGLAAIRAGLQVIVAWLPSRLSADVQARLRRDLFAAFSRASWPVQAAERDGHLQELMTNQVNQATLAVLHLATALSAGAMFVTLAATAFVLSVPVALVVLVTAVSLFGVLRPLTRWGRSAARELSQANLDHASGVGEAVRLAEESQVFGTAAAHRGVVDHLIEDNRRAFFRFQVARRLAQTTYQSLIILLIVAGLAGLYAAGASDLAGLGAVVLILVRAASYGQQLQSANHDLNQMLPFLDRLEGAGRLYTDSAPIDGGRMLPTIRSIAFRRVSFAYGSHRPALCDVSFGVDAGEAIGVVGPSGAGKSTLVQLLLRLREPSAGDYLIDGVPVETFSLADWRRTVAYVPQEPRVFHGTVADNIRYLRDIDADGIERAARMAHIHDDIVSMAEGYETVIGQRADAVSGGQRQRICLARALAGRPEVLILDEPTSALDLASEAAVQASLAELHGQVTMFVVAHRLSTLNICDRILVLAGGELEAFASRSDLERTNSFFQVAATLTGRPA
jgi:ABC-type multidrug transport system fused ATPase/permease subunit